MVASAPPLPLAGTGFEQRSRFPEYARCQLQGNMSHAAFLAKYLYEVVRGNGEVVLVLGQRLPMIAHVAFPVLGSHRLQQLAKSLPEQRHSLDRSGEIDPRLAGATEYVEADHSWR